jgi:hypothetical protein
MSKLSRRSVVAGAAAMPALAAVPAAAMAIPDLAIAAAERLRSAQEAWEAIGDQEPKLPMDHPEYEAWQDRFDDFSDLPNRAHEAMLATRPTTKAGAQAMIEAHLDKRRCSINEDDARALLETLAEAIPHLV